MFIREYLQLYTFPWAILTRCMVIYGIRFFSDDNETALDVGGSTLNRAVLKLYVHNQDKPQYFD